MQAVRDIFGITNDEAAARLWDRLAVAGPLTPIYREVKKIVGFVSA